MRYLEEKNRGFTLLEVLIALAIFTLSIVGLYTVQTRTIVQNTSANHITTSVNWASEKIEDLISLSYDDVILAGDGSETSADGVYTVTWTVEKDVPLENTLTIKMIVTNLRPGPGSLVDLEYIKHSSD